MKFQASKSTTISLILNLLVPGLGHIYWGEYLFGIFIFLIMLLAAALFFVSFLISLPTAAMWILFGLPVVFYIFSFVDLVRTMRTRRPDFAPRSWKWVVFLAVGLLFQSLVPGSPIGFAVKNAPGIETAGTSDFSPVIQRGDMLRVCRLAYSADLPFFKQPVLHTLPSRYDLVRFVDSAGVGRTGVTIGLPGEEIVVVDGLIVANGAPVSESSHTELVLSGDCALTFVNQYHILVATVYLGRIDAVYRVPLTDVTGEVTPLL